MSLLAVSDLTIALPETGDRTHAVDGVGFTIAENEIVCLVGESGSGKSMIAHAILGLLPPNVHPVGGSIRFASHDLFAMDGPRIRALRGGDIAMIFQEPLTALNPLKKVGDQVAEAIRTHNRGQSKTEVTRRVRELFGQVGLPDPERLTGAYPFQLSGGQRQRVMIAMALSNNPRLLIADEPTTALDVTTQRQILDLIKQLQAERGMGVLFITHDIGVVADVADKVVVLQHGKVVEQGASADILHAPRQAYTQMLLDAVPGRGSARSANGAGAMLLEVTGLGKTFVTRQGPFAPRRRVTAADAVSLSLRQGDTLAVVGESGSGKSTLARMILRMIDAERGDILWHGQSVRSMNRAALRQFRRRSQIVFQDPYSSLDPRLKVGESILRGPNAFGATRADAERIARDWLERVGLGAQAFDRFPHEFSGGQRQRICIARALALDPELLIADEAVSALDVSVQSQVLDLLSGLKSEFGLSMLFITHDLRVAREIADRIMVMKSGRVVEQSDAATLFREPKHDYTQSLLDAVPGRDFFAARDAQPVGAGALP